MSRSNRRFSVKGNALLKCDFTKKLSTIFMYLISQLGNLYQKNEISCIFDFLRENTIDAVVFDGSVSVNALT